MQYKTIVLQMLEGRPQLYEQLRSTRTVLSTMEQLATEFKARHEHWKDRLSQDRPTSDPTQIASEALEIALQELQERLPTESPPGDNDPL